MYLRDARVLVPCVASERGSSDRIINKRLKSFAPNSSSQVIDSQVASGSTSGETGSEYALKVLADQKCFWVTVAG